jgi:glycosyltransferase involved in cell wall biosynthesis
MEKMKIKVLILMEYFVPSIKGGGPIRSIKNLVDNLSDDIDFYIITNDRDLGDNNPFNNIPADVWSEIGNIHVYYTNLKKLNLKRYRSLIEEVNYDVLYLNSFFSFRSTIIPILFSLFGKIDNKKIILAPRGEFSVAALSMKKTKKTLYMMLFRVFKIHKKIIWHATTNIEKNDIISTFGSNLKIHIANNLTSKFSENNFTKNLTKNIGEVSLVYISRIHPMKNLLSVLDSMKHVDGNISLDIYGPIEDDKYWSKCMNLINNLKIKVNAKYCGIIQNEKIIELYKNYHFFILLTLGENFGHAIAEAMSGGCPVIISDRTPWINLYDKGVGWDISLNNNLELIQVLKYIVNMDQIEYDLMAKKAFNYIRNSDLKQKQIALYKLMFKNDL